MKEKIFAASLLLTMLSLAATVSAADRQGWYGGLDVGIAFPEDLDTFASDTDIPTNCDQHLGQATVTVDGAPVQVPLGLDNPSCARGQDEWTNDFDMDRGVLVGLNVGYAWDTFRLEAEYFHRSHKGDDSPLILQAGGKDDEFVTATEKISDFDADHFFANVYYDFHDESLSVIPYVGAGLGWMRAEMDFSATFLRNSDRAVISGLGRNPNAAGTLTSADEKLSDTLFGYQLMAGFDYALTEGLYLGVKARYVDFGSEDFKDGAPWDLLRSHASTLAPDGDVVEYTVETDDLNFWGISANLKYFF